MNRSAVTPAGRWSLFVLAARCPQDWKIPRCPLVLMFDLVRSAARLFLIGSAGAMLAVAGFILSILAYIKQTVDRRTPRRLGTEVSSMPESTSLPRDHDLRARNARMPQTPSRHDRLKRSSERPRSSKSSRVRSGPRSTVTSSGSSLGPETPSPEESEPQGPGPSSRSRSQEPESIDGMKSVDDGITASLVAPVLREVSPAPEVTTTVPPLTLRRSLSDVSSAQSSELSARRLSLDGHLPISGRRVLRKIKDSHTNLRERCLTRVQSIPSRRPSARPLRTDPYQAPYYFPSPMSPEAATYVQEVVNERQGINLLSTMNSLVVEPNSLNAITDPSSTRIDQGSERVARPTVSASRPPSPTSSLPVAKVEVSPSTRRHKWSLHFPHLPHHHPVNDGPRLVDGHSQETGGTTVYKELFSKLKLGHHRRRHGIGSVDSHATVSSVAS